MKGPSHQRTQEEIQFVFDSLGWNYSLLCRVKGPMVPAPALASNISLSPSTSATFSSTSIYLGPVYKPGKDKVTKYPSIKISYTGNYLFFVTSAVIQIRRLYKLDNYVIYIIIQIRQLYKLGCFNLTSHQTLNLMSRQTFNLMSCQTFNLMSRQTFNLTSCQTFNLMSCQTFNLMSCQTFNLMSHQTVQTDVIKLDTQSNDLPHY